MRNLMGATSNWVANQSIGHCLQDFTMLASLSLFPGTGIIRIQHTFLLLQSI
jgi:hypothetical protein